MIVEVTFSQSATVRAVMFARSTRLKSALETLPILFSSALSSDGRIVDNMRAGSSNFDSAIRPIVSRRVGAGAFCASASECCKKINHEVEMKI